MEELDRALGRHDAYRKRLATAPLEVQREELAWTFAKAQAADELKRIAARGITHEKLDAVTAEQQPGANGQRCYNGDCTPEGPPKAEQLLGQSVVSDHITL